MTPTTLRRKLARDFPIKRKIRVLFGECEPDHLAEISMEGDDIWITIGPSTPDEQAHHLLHEYCHAIVFDRHGKQMPRHTVEWARVYAKLYQFYYD